MELFKRISRYTEKKGRKGESHLKAGRERSFKPLVVCVGQSLSNVNDLLTCGWRYSGAHRPSFDSVRLSGLNLRLMLMQTEESQQERMPLLFCGFKVDSHFKFEKRKMANVAFLL